MSFLMMRSAGPAGGGLFDPVPAGSYHVAKSTGSDANDGILSGDGGTGAWATADKAFAECAAGTFGLVAAGSDIDIIFHNEGDGIYDIDTYRVLTGGGSTTLARKIRFRTDPDESAVTLQTVGEATILSANSNRGPLVYGSGNITFERFYISFSTQVFYLDSSAVPTAVAPGCQLLNITATWNTVLNSIDNHGFVKFNSDTGGAWDDWLIQYCDLEGDGPTAGAMDNSSTLYFETATSTIHVRESILTKNANGQVCYWKHPPGSDPGLGGNTKFTNVVLRHKGASDRSVIHGSPNRVEFSNVLFIGNNSINQLGPSGGDALGYSANHANVWDHVTFYRATVGAALRIEDLHAGATSGEDNTITNSAFINTTVWIGRTGTWSYAHNTTMDYNLYQVTGDAVTTGPQGSETTYDLAGWVANYGQDANSVEEDFIADVTIDVTDYTTFAPDATSEAFNAGSDGNHIGFYDTSWLSLVGAGASAP